MPQGVKAPLFLVTLVIPVEIVEVLRNVYWIFVFHNDCHKLKSSVLCSSLLPGHPLTL